MGIKTKSKQILKIGHKNEYFQWIIKIGTENTING